jgi:hypothetical protein
MFFGFHAGELLRGFGLYALYRELNPQSSLPDIGIDLRKNQ